MYFTFPAVFAGTPGQERGIRMVTISSAAASELITVGIEPGEMLLETIKDAIAERDIRNGVVISGIGTLKTCTMHYVTHTEFPPTDEFYTIEKPMELLSVSGIIADSEPHLHIVVSVKDKEVYCGHLEPGSEVLYLAEIAIQKCNDLAMTRVADTERGVKLLRPAQ
jgi:predicted DNA-binding protein with PD1-like motif